MCHDHQIIKGAGATVRMAESSMVHERMSRQQGRSQRGAVVHPHTPSVVQCMHRKLFEFTSMSVQLLSPGVPWGPWAHQLFSIGSDCNPCFHTALKPTGWAPWLCALLSSPHPHWIWQLGKEGHTAAGGIATLPLPQSWTHLWCTGLGVRCTFCLKTCSTAQPVSWSSAAPFTLCTLPNQEQTTSVQRHAVTVVCYLIRIVSSALLRAW